VEQGTSKTETLNKEEDIFQNLVEIEIYNYSN